MLTAILYKHEANSTLCNTKQYELTDFSEDIFANWLNNENIFLDNNTIQQLQIVMPNGPIRHYNLEWSQVINRK